MKALVLAFFVAASFWFMLLFAIGILGAMAEDCRLRGDPTMECFYGAIE